MTPASFTVRRLAEEDAASFREIRLAAVTQSPEANILRAICACTASTSSISDGGERMQPR